jgi:hypothetical protein
MRRLSSPRIAVAAGLTALLLLLAAVPLSILAGKFTVNGLLFPVILVLPFACLGVPVALRQPQNLLGWVVLLFSLTQAIWQDAELYSTAVYGGGGHDLPFARVAVALTGGWLGLILLLPLPILLFPDGRVPSQRLRWTARVYLALAVIAVVDLGVEQSHAFTDRQVRVNSSGDLVQGSLSTPLKVASLVWASLYIALCGSWVVGQVLAYRRSTGERRQQVKWLMTGGGIAVGGLVTGGALSNSHSPVLSAVSGAGFMAVVALPIGIAVGILKYRLYEIDRLISRTISYVVVTGTLTGVFFAVVALMTRVLPFSSPVGVASSTLAAAALFNPLRRRVQSLVDRRFHRARYDAEIVVAAFTHRLRASVDLQAVGADLLATVDGAVQPSHASLWIRPAG